jgi:hypothetical protein
MADKHNYKYVVVDDGEELEDATTFGSKWGEEFPNYIVEDAAEYEYHNCDGWERDWPMTFKIWGMDDRELGVFEVGMDMSPTFVADLAGVVED